MNCSELTERYLDEVRRRRAWPNGTVDGRSALMRSRELCAGFPIEYLTRPLFLSRAEVDTLARDLDHVLTALYELRGKLFGGDRAEFARAAGLTEVQVAATTTGPPGTTRLMRADLFRDASGFRLLEVNISVALGGMGHADIAELQLHDTVLSEFAAAHGLGCPDTMHAIVATMLAETGHAPGSSPVVAIADWPPSYDEIGLYLRGIATRWRELGLQAQACHVGELQLRDGRVWLHGTAVDIVARIFLIEEIDSDPELVAPLLTAAARGEVTLFPPMDVDPFSSKGALALLSDTAHRCLLSAEQRGAVERLVPWTRRLLPGRTTLEDGSEIDLLPYAIEHQQDLVIKPAAYTGSAGIVLGWAPETTADNWRASVTAALDGHHVIQRRVDPLPEMFFDADGHEVAWNVVWGAFVTNSGWAGVWARGATTDSPAQVVSLSNCAALGSCLYPT